MRIVIIGPVYPYKGGIAHDTALMCKALRKNHSVQLLSFKLQYPRVLFKKAQKDYANKTFYIDGVEYCIDTTNPINWIRTAKRINQLKPKLVIIPWWHPYFAPCFLTICKLLKGIKVLFVCHNVFPHERFPMDRLLTEATLRKGDLFIVHSIQDETDLRTVVKSPRYRKTGVPEYDIFKQKNMSVAEARRLTGLTPEDHVLLFFGLIREYKGLHYLLDAMPEIMANVKNAKLIVAGEFRGEKDKYVQQARELSIDNAVEFHDEYVPDSDVEKYFQASDLVVLPYVSATQSGVVQIALSFEKPVVVTNVGGLPEVVQDGKTGYLIPPKDSSAIAGAVCRFFNSDDNSMLKESIREHSKKISWDDQITEAVEYLAGMENET